jgi:hypothetical protein
VPQYLKLFLHIRTFLLDYLFYYKLILQFTFWQVLICTTLCANLFLFVFRTESLNALSAIFPFYEGFSYSLYGHAINYHCNITTRTHFNWMRCTKVTCIILGHASHLLTLWLLFSLGQGWIFKWIHKHFAFKLTWTTTAEFNINSMRFKEFVINAKNKSICVIFLIHNNCNGFLAYQNVLWCFFNPLAYYFIMSVQNTHTINLKI